MTAGDIAGAGNALERFEAERLEDLGESTLVRGMVAWHTGDWDRARRVASEAVGLAADPGDLALLNGMLAHVDGGWEQHARLELTHIWDSPEVAGKVFDSYLCVTEYVLTAGDPYERLAGFAKRLRAQAQQAGARRGEAFAATVLGETELFTGNLEAARAHLSTRRGSAARWARSRASRSHARGWARRCCISATGRGRGPSSRRHSSSPTSHRRRASGVPRLRRARARARGQRRGARADRARRDAVRPALGLPVLPDRLPRRRGGGVRPRGQLERAREFLERAEFGAARWPGGPWPAALAEARGGCCSPKATSAPPRTLCAAPPRATPRPGSCSTNSGRARRSTAAQADDQRLGRFEEGVPATLPACKRNSHIQASRAVAACLRCSAWSISW